MLQMFRHCCWMLIFLLICWCRANHTFIRYFYYIALGVIKRLLQFTSWEWSALQSAPAFSYQMAQWITNETLWYHSSSTDQAELLLVVNKTSCFSFAVFFFISSLYICIVNWFVQYSIWEKNLNGGPWLTGISMLPYEWVDQLA